MRPGELDRLRTLSLFSGGGGLDEGLAGWCEPIAYCESDPYAQGVLLSRMARGDIPRAPVWPDVRSLRAEHFGAERVEAICGGFPCQDISLAGRGGGLDGERSGLFFEVARLARELRPSVLFLENVPALVTRGLDRVLLELDDLGFDARWTIVSAAEVGAPHLRKRVFLVAAHAERLGLREFAERMPGGRAPGVRREGEAEPGDDGAQEPLADAGGSGRQAGEPLPAREPEPWRGSPSVGDADGARLALGQHDDRHQPRKIGAAIGADWWAVEPELGRVAHGVAHRVHRIRVLGNGVVPAQAREAFTRLLT